MTKRILIIGGYGNFGRFITKVLAREPNIEIIIGGRNIKKAEDLVRTLNTANPVHHIWLDIRENLSEVLQTISPDIVIHTSGPYQTQDYIVARECIGHGSHYIDLADARAFVANIIELDERAKAKGVMVCSGASTLPTLTSAIIDAYKSEFSALEGIEYAIATAQLTNRGVATTYAILSYAGKAFKALRQGKTIDVYGWLGLKSHKFWQLGRRLMGDCDIPDLELFPKRYPTLKTITFKAALELKIQQVVLAGLSWLVRLKLITSLQPLTPYLLKISRTMDFLGSDNSGFYMELKGRDHHHKNKTLLFEIFAEAGDGLYIPCIPAILMAKRMAKGDLSDAGAFPCMGFINLTQYLSALDGLRVQWRMHELAE